MRYTYTGLCGLTAPIPIVRKIELYIFKTHSLSKDNSIAEACRLPSRKGPGSDSKKLQNKSERG